MTKDDIIQLVHQAIEQTDGDDSIMDTPDWLVIFAHLVASAEREACAKLCDVLAVHPEYASEVTKLAAMAIRARSQS